MGCGQRGQGFGGDNPLLAKPHYPSRALSHSCFSQFPVQTIEDVRGNPGVGNEECLAWFLLAEGIVKRLGFRWKKFHPFIWLMNLALFYYTRKKIKRMKPAPQDPQSSLDSIPATSPTSCKSSLLPHLKASRCTKRAFRLGLLAHPPFLPLQ